MNSRASLSISSPTTEPPGSTGVGLASTTFARVCSAPRAGIAQLVEHQLPKLRVAGSNPVSRSKKIHKNIYLSDLWNVVCRRRGDFVGNFAPGGQASEQIRGHFPGLQRDRRHVLIAPCPGRVMAGGDLPVGVPELLRDVRGGHSRRQQVGGVRVPQVLQADLGQAGPLQDPPPLPLAEVARVHGGEHPHSVGEGLNRSR